MGNPITIGNRAFKSQESCKVYTRQLLKRIGETHSIKRTHPEYYEYFYLLCKRHPNQAKMSKCVDFQIYKNLINKNSFGVNIVNDDNTITEISMRICITMEKTSNIANFNAALRQCISHQILAYKNNADLSYCSICNCSLHDKNIHIDHVVKFRDLVRDFMEINQETIGQIPDTYSKTAFTFLTIFKNEDKWIGDLFEEYHLNNATLRVACDRCNYEREK